LFFITLIDFILVFIQSGRVLMDMFPLIQLEHKLASYTLNHVSEHFLKDRKEDVPPKHIAQLFFGDATQVQRLAKVCSHSDGNKILSSIMSSLFFACFFHAFTIIKRAVFCFDFCSWTLSHFLSFHFVQYCVKDTLLPLRLMRHLSTLINQIEMSRVTGVPLTALMTKGQQYKVFSQICRHTCKSSM
jgi:DNA polymerase elongation subunit (family B)